MTTIESGRQRLSTLSTRGVGTLEDCRSLQEQLRSLKREILAELMEIRTRMSGQARTPLGPKPTLEELWDRRGEGAQRLLDDVKSRVTRLLETDTQKAVEEWSLLNGEIDDRLLVLAELELELGASSGDPGFPDQRSAKEDEIYARVGAAVRSAEKQGPFCPQCGKGVHAGHRFCSHCGHLLDPGEK